MESQDLTNVLLGIIAVEGALIVYDLYTTGGGNRPGGPRPDGSPTDPSNPVDPGNIPSIDPDKKIG